MPTEHALLSASSAQRWLNCPGSVALTADLPDTAGQAAAEGTLAHAICELRLRKQYLEPMGPRTYNSRLKKLQADPLYTAEMLEGADDYIDAIEQLYLERPDRPHVAVEHRVDYSQYAPEGFGTADCILIGGGIIDVIDYKFGKGHRVAVEDNPQLKLYALGALGEYGLFYPIDVVRLTIVQPRNGGTSSWSVGADELKTWGRRITPIAEAAFSGFGEVFAGDWCEASFCPLRATCRERSDAMILSEFSGNYPDLPPTLTDSEVGDVLNRARDLASWVKQLEDYALAAILDGRDIPGWKAVEGRSNRTITDADKVAATLTGAGYDAAVLYKPKELLGITALESLVGKKKFSTLVADYLQKPPGKPALVPDSDPRSAYTSNSVDDEFGDKINETGETEQ